MADQARIYSPTGTIRRADSIRINEQSADYYCKTDGCSARMYFCNGGTKESFFRSRRIADHISSDCIKNSIVFHAGKYSENTFNLAFAFESILGLKHSRTMETSKPPVIPPPHEGGGRRNRIRTLPLLYAMCRTLGKSGRYNGYLVDDILADDENFTRYGRGISGYKLVETSYYRKPYNELAFIMNYPCDGWKAGSPCGHVKISFPRHLNDYYWDLYHKLKVASHVEPIIIAGNWQPSASKDYQSECEITSTHQIHWVKERPS